MRNPFRIKNSIQYSNWRLPARSQLSFEEVLSDPEAAEALEREDDPKPHARVLGLLTLLAFAFLAARFYYVAVVKHDYFRSVAEGNRLRVEYLPAPRGAIYDSYGKLLAGSRPSFELVANPLDIPQDETQRERVIAKVAGIAATPVEEIKQILSSSKAGGLQSILIKQNIPREQVLVFAERAGELPGFSVLNTPIRDYKFAHVYSHMIGYVGKINGQEYEQKKNEGYLFNDALGKTGLEQVYEKNLRGKFGEKQVEVDARGAVKKVFGEKASQPGENLVLNIDSGLQEKLFESLTRRLQLLNRKKAAAIAMNPQTGQILAYLSLPGYDNNLFAAGISSKDYQAIAGDANQPLFNRGITGTYPSGSVIKPVVAAAALQEKEVTPSTIIQDSGAIVIDNVFGGPDYEFIGYRRKALGLLDLRKALALSSDIFFYIVAGGYEPAKIRGMGIDKLAQYYRSFHLGEKLGIDLVGERSGLVPTPEWKKEYFGSGNAQARWYLGDTYHVAIGQGDLLVTPLQVLSWVCTVANNGRIYRPFIANRIEDNSGQVLRKIEPQLLGTVPVSEENLRVVQEGMRMAVTDGTARTLNSLPIQTAAKTGTAQFDARDRNRSHAWFTAYAPYENPQIAIVVLIEDGGEGGVSSAPVVKEALDWWIKNRYQQ